MRYAIVGTGSRHAMYRDALVERTIDPGGQLVALCDSNPARLELSASSLPAAAGAGVGRYAADAFDRMIAERRPDTVIVTTPDDLHDVYIVRALQAGSQGRAFSRTAREGTGTKKKAGPPRNRIG